MPRTRKELSWKPGYSLTRRPIRRSIARRNKSNRPAGHQEYEFVCEYPVADGMIRYDSISRDSGSLPLATTREAAHAQPDGAEMPTKLSSRSLTSQNLDASGFSLNNGCKIGKRRPGSSRQTSRATCQDLIRLASATISPASISETGWDLQTASLFSPSIILFNDLVHQYEPVLIRYNEEFCKIPLTTDLKTNPFQCQNLSQTEPTFLAHAVMALAGHHVESTQTQHHRHASLQMLRQRLDSGDFSQAHHMLDAILLLFSLDETQSAFGNWGTHLTGAYALLETGGGIDQWRTSRRQVVQVGILTWWDAILNLVAREDCVFPIEYFEAIIEAQNEDQCDYFGLCGCPRPLVAIVMQLARLGAEKKRSLYTPDAFFDEDAVLEVEHALESWYYVSRLTPYEDEESMQQDQDQMHCSEAWRHGMLLYIYRVFYWKPGQKVPMCFLSRARIITDHIFASRDDEMIARQALLPLFLAGCELKDRSTRRKIIRYCAKWNDRTRYYMFSSTVPLLEQVWAEQEEKGVENTWWGQVVDDEHAKEGEEMLPRRLCFG